MAAVPGAAVTLLTGHRENRSTTMHIYAGDYPRGYPPLLEWVKAAGLDPNAIGRDDFSATDESGEWVIRYRVMLVDEDGHFRRGPDDRYLRGEWQTVTSSTPPPDRPSEADQLRSEAAAIRDAAAQ